VLGHRDDGVHAHVILIVIPSAFAVILSEAKDRFPWTPILRYAQDDKHSNDDWQNRA
jgi:hypothetical protein